MQNLSFLSFVLISFPEQVIAFFLGILTIGKYSFLKVRSNYLRILIASSIMTVATYLMRRHLGIQIETTFLSAFLCIIIFIYIIRFKFYESITASIFAFLILALTELPMSILMSSVLDVKDEKDLYQNITKLFISVFSIRSIQILIVLLLYISKVKIIDMERTDIRRREYYIQLVVYLISICTLVFLAIIMANTLIFNNEINISSSNAYLLRINIYISLFVTVILTLAIRGTHEFYKNKSVLNNNEVVQSIEYINSLIDEQNYKDAKDALNTLKTHIVNN